MTSNGLGWVEAMRPNPQAAAREAFEKQGSDPDKTKKALEDAAGLARTLWVSYLSVGTYLVVAVGAVTHEDMMRGKGITLPFVSVELPLVPFFAIAPILFLILHLYLMLNLKLLADQVKGFSRLIREAELAAAVEERVRLQLPNFLIVQALGATQAERKSFSGRMVALTAWLTLVIAPLVLLLFMQLRFLPYHSPVATWVQRTAIGADLVFIVLLWPRILELKDTLPRFALRFCGVSILPVFAFFVATFPGEAHEDNAFRDLPVWLGRPLKIFQQKLDQPIAPLNFQQALQRIMLCRLPEWSRLGTANEICTEQLQLLGLHATLFQGSLNQVTRQRNSLFSNTLVLPGFDDVDDEKLSKLEEREKDIKLEPGRGERLSSYRGRDLRGAILIDAKLTRTDLTGAQLQGAFLDGAELQNALLACAATGKSGNPLDDGCTHLERASLVWASLQGASLAEVSLQGASLTYASLQGASLAQASLQGASLAQASLQGASLVGASLQGASLELASLQCALLSQASLQGASLLGASLQGASLTRASLLGASLGAASLQGASLDRASLLGALLNGVSLWRTTVDAGNDLSHTKIYPFNDQFVWGPKRKKTRGRVFDRWRKGVEDAALKGVPENKRQDVKFCLAKLDFDALSVEKDRENRAFWLAATRNGADEVSFQKVRTEQLTQAACEPENAPYVARGIASNFLVFDRTKETDLPLLEKLLDPACRGTQGFSEEELQRLVATRDILRNGDQPPKD